LILETAAALRVAQSLTPATKAHLHECLDDLRRAEVKGASFAERLGADLALHEAICVASGNRTLDELWRALIGRTTVMQLSVREEDLGHFQDADSHRPLLDAIESGDEALIRKTYRRVFEEGRQTVLESVKRNHDDPCEKPATSTHISRAANALAVDT
jgi:DNA-binding GntR family transcriptional regulator